MIINFEYRIAGKFGGESSVICRTKTIQINIYNNNNLWLIYKFAKLSFAKCLKRVNSPNFPPPNFPAIRYCSFYQFP